MKFTERLIVFLKTLNPDMYESLCHMTMANAWKQFFFNYLFIFLLMLILFVPASMVHAPVIEERLASFSTLEIDATAEAEGRVLLFGNPKVVVDLSESPELGRETILFSTEGVAWKSYYFFGKSFVPWSDIKDLSDSESSTLFLLLLFLAPSIAFWIGITFLLFYIALILIFSVLAFLVPRIWRHTISYNHALKLCLFAATVAMAVEMLLLPFWWNWWIPLILYVIFLAIGIALVGDRELSGKKRKKSHEIWD